MVSKEASFCCSVPSPLLSLPWWLLSWELALLLFLEVIIVLLGFLAVANPWRSCLESTLPVDESANVSFTLTLFPREGKNAGWTKTNDVRNTQNVRTRIHPKKKDGGKDNDAEELVPPSRLWWWWKWLDELGLEECAAVLLWSLLFPPEYLLVARGIFLTNERSAIKRAWQRPIRRNLKVTRIQFGLAQRYYLLAQHQTAPAPAANNYQHQWAVPPSKVKRWRIFLQLAGQTSV